MLEDIERLRPVNLPLNGGLDEESPSDSLAIEDAVVMTNWRLSKDGKRIQKRLGLSEEVTDFGEDVYGYSTYKNGALDFCQIAVLESRVMRKIASGSWTTILTFTGKIDHTVKMIEVQGKQYIITENGSCVILPDNSVRNIGISPPTTIPILTSDYVAAGGSALSENFSLYANTVALNSVWTCLDDPHYSGVSSLQLIDPYSTPGPDADGHYMKFYCPVNGPYNIAKRQRTIGDVGSIFSFDFAVYFKTLNDYHRYGKGGDSSGLRVVVDNGIFITQIQVCHDGVYVQQNSGLPVRIGFDAIPLSKWIKFNFYIDGTDTKNVIIHGYKTISGTMTKMDEIPFYNPNSTTQHEIIISLKNNAPEDAQEVWVDNFHIVSGNTETAVIAGMFRYAISFAKTGDFGCESRPIKSKIGTVSFTTAPYGPHLNDMTIDPDSEYTGSGTVTLRVKVKSTNPDIVQWSKDGGLNWSSTVAIASKVYLAFGIIINFAASTGHGVDDYWEIPCYAISVIATMQEVTLSGIPVSTDPQVNARKIYRSVDGGATFFYLTTIFDNTTTTFVDNMPDMTLGEQMEEDRNQFTDASTTIGRISEWWDNRLWIVDNIQNIIYYSAVRAGGAVPEEFSIDTRFLPIRKGNQGDSITAIKAFKDSLYIFKRNDIFVVQRTYVGYGVYQLNSDVGCVADGCVEEVNDYLMFPSERGLELYDGIRPYRTDFSTPVHRTWSSITADKYKYLSISHDKMFNEVWLSTGTTKVIVWNYDKNKFYLFDFYKVPSFLVNCQDSIGTRVLKMGTTDGFVDLCNSGYTDGATPIVATYRKGWIDTMAHGIAHLLMTKYELPNGKTITVNLYNNMEKEVARTYGLTGVTPTSTDIEIRRIIGDKTELGLRGRWYSVEYVNGQDCGGDCKINSIIAFIRAETVKGKSFGN